MSGSSGLLSPSTIPTKISQVEAEIHNAITSPHNPQQGDLRLSGPPSGQGAGGGARTRDRRVPADLRADSLATVPPTPPK
ncbi:hypothetical protein PoB_001290200 [Plakobranchus ocellatus]|uniref:Uncharacterized protein n=1 Tax=Plakobranchus ocellatus TaxID=259542 RepID=A0AAV3YV81_9GAST|nr:hypothetical protein PoB_001290200 [Plakobranchus ocellatus]